MIFAFVWSKIRLFKRTLVSQCLLVVLVAIAWMPFLGIPAAIAGLNDDHFDGNIFALYGGNGSLVPPRVSLADSLKREDRATLLMFYVEDSSDCKQYATVISGLQGYYGRVTDFIPYNVDAIPVKSSYDPSEPGYYYQGGVPQTVVFNQKGQVVLNVKGIVPFEQVDDAMRKVFDLLPRSESVELKRRPVNEINVELSR